MLEVHSITLLFQGPLCAFIGGIKPGYKERAFEVNVSSRLVKCLDLIFQAGGFASNKKEAVMIPRLEDKYGVESHLVNFSRFKIQLGEKFIESTEW